MRPRQALSDTVARTAFSLERRLSVFGAGLVFALTLLGLSLLSITPTNSTFAINPFNTHSRGYAHLSENPFDVGHPLIGRVLTPFVAHYVGLTGERFIYVPLVVGVLFLALVYTHFRRQGAAPLLALAALATMAFSSAITMMFHLGAFPDTTSFALLMLAFMLLATPWWGIPFALGLLNHEAGVIYLPVFVILAYAAGHRLPMFRRVMRVLLPCVFSLGVMGVWRYVLRDTAAYDADAMYLTMANLRAQFDDMLYRPLGMFMAFKLFWAIPLCAATLAATRQNYQPAIVLVAIVLPVMGILLVATDTSRLAAFGFLAVIYGIEALRKHIDDRALATSLGFIVIANLLVPTYHVWSTFMSYSPPAPIGYLLSLQGVQYVKGDSNITPLFEQLMKPRTTEVSLDRLSKPLLEGSAFNDPAALVFSGNLHVTFPSVTRVDAIRLQADHNDSYVLRWFLDGAEVGRFEVPTAADAGLRTRNIEVGGLWADSVLIEPGVGDGLFSVSAMLLR